MGQVECLVVDAISQRLQPSNTPKTLGYTGGCWLYGETGNAVAAESSAFNPIEGCLVSFNLGTGTFILEHTWKSSPCWRPGNLGAEGIEPLINALVSAFNLLGIVND